VLDIGCGYGTLVERVGERGASAVGITVCREQARHCRARQLDVHLLDYRALPADWDGTFDSVIANGSMEHFVQPQHAASGRSDPIYRDLFARVHRLIDPQSTARRFVTTTIHFVRPPRDPLDLTRSPFSFRWGSDNFHWAVLERGWGGYYPVPGQLQRAAAGYFDLIAEVDGTEDYRFTSEEWLRRVRRAVRSRRVGGIARRSLPLLVHSTRQFLTLMLYLFVTESWNWQFRPPHPPARLLRQTWAYRDRA
jgi:cyclopropane fatty-acyl-phospholipid synthase-like methyltransferase